VTQLLLDTTFLIDAERTGTQLDTAIGDDDDVAVAAITIAELLVGVELAAKKYQVQRRNFVESIAEAIPVLAYDLSIAREHAALLGIVRQQGRPRGAHDLIIAATARATKRTILSADRTAFADLPGVVERDHRG